MHTYNIDFLKEKIYLPSIVFSHLLSDCCLVIVCFRITEYFESKIDQFMRVNTHHLISSNAKNL